MTNKDINGLVRTLRTNKDIKGLVRTDKDW